MANQRTGVPAGWTWRDGRPRWKASPTLRRAGWRDRDLKDPNGRWLPRGASIDAAQAIMDGVATWRAGGLVPASLAAIAPRDASVRAGAGLPQPLSALSIGALVDAFVGIKAKGRKGAWIQQPSKEALGLATTTRESYRRQLKRLVDTLAGYAALPAPGDVKAVRAYDEAVAAVRAMSIFTLEPELDLDGNVISEPLYQAYHDLKGEVGVPQAAGVLAAASAWLAWCHERKNRRISNWAKEVRRETPAGRLRPLTWEEVFALVEAADRMGLPSIGDGVILGVDLSWSQIDRLKLTWSRLVNDRALTGSEGRQKTGRVGGTPLLDGLGIPRVAQIRERQAAMPAHPTHVLWCELTNTPWVGSTYRHYFGLVRAEAAKAVPSVITATDQDLRDTAITIGRIAGLDIDEICSRTLQSRKNVLALLDKHYGEIGEEIADAGRDRLNAYLKAKNVGA